MEKKFKNNVLPNIKNSYEKYEVWVLMKNYNVWHKHTECLDFDLALSECKRLEKNCSCFTEIRHIKENVSIVRRYVYLNKD